MIQCSKCSDTSDYKSKYHVAIQTKENSFDSYHIHFVLHNFLLRVLFSFILFFLSRFASKISLSNKAFRSQVKRGINGISDMELQSFSFKWIMAIRRFRLDLNFFFLGLFKLYCAKQDGLLDIIRNTCEMNINFLRQIRPTQPSNKRKKRNNEKKKQIKTNEKKINADHLL